MTTIVSILILAVIVEGIVEYFVKPAVKPDTYPALETEQMQAVGAVDWRSLALRYSAAVIAVGLCLVYGADVLDMAGLTSPYPVVGQVVTGLLISRGANFVNDFADTWLSPLIR